MKKAAEKELTDEQIQQLIDKYILAITAGLKDFETTVTDTLTQNMPEMLVELGDPPYDPTVVEQLRLQKESLISKYGKVFEQQYGWAAHALDRPKGGVQFRNIEKNVKLDHLRPYYHMASHGVHANSKGPSGSNCEKNV